MRRSSRALALLLTVLMVASPAASAAGSLPGIIDDRIGDTNDAIQTANSTYGERDEFRRATASLSRSSLALINNATVVSFDSLIKANGGLETGKARAQASGSGSDQKVVDHGRQLASQARSQLQEVRNNLKSMERTGLEPIAFAGGLTSAYAANRAMDLLRQHQTALDQWEKGNKNEQVEAGIVSGAAGATVAAGLAADVLKETTKARADASTSQLLSAEELDKLVEDRVGWTKANAAPAAKKSREKVLQMSEQDERLMTLSAYTLYFQDVAFNGIRQQAQRGEDVDAFEEARNLYERDKPHIEDWSDTLGIPMDLPIGAMDSANLTLVLNQNATGKAREQAGAFALGLAHLGAEQAGLLQQAYGSQDHEPGTELKEASLSADDEGGFSAVPAPGVLAVVAALALAAFRVRRDRR